MTYEEQTPKPTSIPEILKAPIPGVPEGRVPIRILICGVEEGVNSTIHELHVKKFSEVVLWTPPLPSVNEGEIIRMLTRHFKPSS